MIQMSGKKENSTKNKPPRKNRSLPAEHSGDRLYLEKIFAAAPDSYLLLSPDFIIKMATNAYLNFTYTQREEIIGQYFFDVFPEDQPGPEENAAEMLRSSLQEVKATQKPQQLYLQLYQLRSAKKNQNSIYPRIYQILNTPVLNDEGTVEYLIHKIEPAPALVQTEKELLESKEIYQLQVKQTTEKGPVPLTEENYRAKEIPHELTARENITGEKVGREESKNLLPSFFATSLIGMSVLEAVRDHNGTIEDFRIKLVNKALEQETHRTDLLDKLYTNEFPEVKKAGLFDLMLKVMETGQPEQLEYFYPHQEFNKWFSCTFVKTDIGLIASTLDITDRKLAEIKVQEQAHLIQRITQIVPDMISVMQLEPRTVQYLNKEVYTLYGFNPEDMALLNKDELAELIHPEDRQFVKEYFEKFHTISDEEIITADYRAKGFTKDWQWFHVRGKVFQRNEKGTATHILNVVQNFTARKKAEEELLRIKDKLTQQVTDKYQALFSSIDEGFYHCEIISDENDQPTDVFYLEANPAATRMMGQDFTGLRLKEIKPDYETFWFETFCRVARNGVAERFEQYFAPNKKWFDFYVFKMGYEYSRQVAVVFHDITERKKAEEALRQSEERKSFLLKLSDVLQPLADPVQIQDRAAQAAMNYFNADRCYYCEIEGDTALIRRDAFRKNLPSVAGSYALNSMPLFKAILETGRTFVISDVSTTNLMDEGLKQLCLHMQLLSFINVPVIKNGQPVGILCLTQSTPRNWIDLEVELVEVIAERTGAAIERAKAEEALRQSEENFRAMFEVSSVGKAQAEAHTRRFLRVNAALCQITGYSEAELLTMTVNELNHPEDRELDLAMYRKLIEKDGVYEFEKRYIRKNGSIVWVNVTGNVIWDNNGQPIRTASVIQDITKRKRAEAALLKQEAEFRTIANAAPAFVWICEPSGKAIFLNDRWCEFTGITRTETLGNNWTKAVHPKDWERMAPYWEHCQETGETYEGECRYRRDDGEYRWHAFRALPQYDLNGKIEAWYGISNDVHDTKMAQEALRKSEEQFRLFVTTISDTVYKMSPDWSQMLQLKGKDFLADPDITPNWLQTYIHPDDQPAVLAAIQEASQNKSIFEQEHRVYLANGTIGWILSRAIPVLNEHGEISEWFGSASDITARKKAEHQLLEFNALLEKQIADRTRALRESKEWFEAAINVSPVVLSILKTIRNSQGEIIDFYFEWVSKSGEKMVGKDVTGKLLKEQFSHLWDIGVFAKFAYTVETGEPTNFEYFYRSDGFNLWVHWKAVQLENGLFVSVEDISERKNAEEELKKSMALLQQAEELARMGSWEYNLNTREFIWSEGMYRLFGLKKDTPISLQTYRDAAIDEDLPQAEKIICCLSEQPASFEEILQIKLDGTTQTLKVKGTLVKDAAGKPAKILGLDLNITEVKRLEEENLELRLWQQKELLLAILAAQEEERRRISESLHNGVGQILYAAQLSLQQVEFSKLTLPVPELESTKVKTEILIKDAIREVRQVSHELVPLLLEEFGLDIALQDFCERFSHTGIQLSCQGLMQRLEKYLELAIYRISQELINNIAKHSGATRARLEMFREKEQIIIEAQDNGKGMEPNASHRKGIGLKTIRDRVNLLGGFMEIESTPRKGTLITIFLPLNLSLGKDT